MSLTSRQLSADASVLHDQFGPQKRVPRAWLRRRHGQCSSEMAQFVKMRVRHPQAVAASTHAAQSAASRAGPPLPAVNTQRSGEGSVNASMWPIEVIIASADNITLRNPAWLMGSQVTRPTSTMCYAWACISPATRTNALFRSRLRQRRQEAGADHPARRHRCW